MRRLALMVLLGLRGASPASAHDLWLQPDPAPGHGEPVRIRAVVGAVFPKGEEVKKIADYVAARLQRDGTFAPLAGSEKDPTLLGEVTGDGAFYVSARVPKRELDLNREEVREYLREEAGWEAGDIDAVLKESGPVLHETYSRCIKLLMIPRGAKSLPSDVPFGLPLEVELLKWDRGRDPRIRFSFRLLKDGKPLPDAPVRVLRGGSKAVVARTDDRGEARVLVEPGAPVLVAFVSLVGSEKGRYETLWTNLAIFDVRGSDPGP